MSEQAEIEKINFKIELYSTNWSKLPTAEILINDDSKYKAEINGTEKEPTVIEFQKELTAGEKYKLRILRTGKDKGQTIVNEKGDILKDQLLHIKSIEIDEIDIGSLIYEGLYTPEYPEPWYSQQIKANKTPEKSFKNATSMGHNGIWEFKFQSPFYMWLLENLY